MSDRLYEIINQCFIGTTEGKLSDLNTIRNVERFAEEIVRECVGLVACHSHVSGYELANILLDNFGIKE